MAVPKGKQSKRRTNSRFANWKLDNVNLVECPQCHELKTSHTVCNHCGYYNGKPVVVVKENKD